MCIASASPLKSLCLCLYISVKSCGVILLRLSHSPVSYMWRGYVTAAVAVVGIMLERHTTKQCPFVWCTVHCVPRLLFFRIWYGRKAFSKPIFDDNRFLCNTDFADSKENRLPPLLTKRSCSPITIPRTTIP